MALQVGDRVEEKAHSTERRGRVGVVRKVVRTTPAPCYRIRWDDGHESTFTPAAGSLDKLPARTARDPRRGTHAREQTKA